MNCNCLEKIEEKELIEIIRPAVEEVWYNRRSLNPVEEQINLIATTINNKFKELASGEVSQQDIVANLRLQIKNHFDSENTILNNTKTEMNNKEYEFRKVELERQKFYIMLILSNSRTSFTDIDKKKLDKYDKQLNIAYAFIEKVYDSGDLSQEAKDCLDAMREVM